MEYRYKTRGVCSSEILLELDGDVVKSAKFVGGCNGNRTSGRLGSGW